MSTHHKLNNPEIEDSMDYSQTDSQTSSITMSRISKTSECSTQVNMDEQFPPEEHSKQKKKNKKKQYKRKKKQKLREDERSAKVHLARLIDQIYQRQINFEKCEKEVKSYLPVLVDGNKFHPFLNQAIRIHVNNIQKEIWDYMQSLIQENPMQKFDDDQNFYLRMVDKIYQQYQKLQYSSREIEKIINHYMVLSETQEQNFTECQNLDISTFNYLIESDESIKNLIHICERRISIRHQVQVQRLREIGDMMNSEEDEEEYYEQEQERTEKSTSVEEQDHEMKKKKKKKKKKNKDLEYSCKTEDILNRMYEMIIIDEARLNCKVEEQWISKIGVKYSVPI